MKIKNLFLIVIAVLTLSGQVPQKAENMGVTFNKSNYVTWSQDNLIPATSQITFINRMNPTGIDSLKYSGVIQVHDYSADGTTLIKIAYRIILMDDAAPYTKVIAFFTYNNTGALNGVWRTNTNAFSYATPFDLAVTYDATSTANAPVIYINGSPVTVNVDTAPLSVNAMTNFKEIYMATAGAGGRFYGTIISSLVYNRILAASEIAEAHNSRLAVPTYRGLVFAPLLIGATGLQTFDGSALTTSNKIVDQISSALGTPGGSPVGQADQYLTY